MRSEEGEVFKWKDMKDAIEGHIEYVKELQITNPELKCDCQFCRDMELDEISWERAVIVEHFDSDNPWPKCECPTCEQSREEMAKKQPNIE